MKPKVTWIVLADGDQAKVFENDGPGKGLTAVKDFAIDQAHLRARDIMADKPGRASAGPGPGAKSAMEYHTDPVEVRERRFVEHLADLLEAKRVDGRFARLVIAAAPNALGDLRPALTPALKKIVIAELPKDLIRVPLTELGEHFEDILAI